MHEHATKTKSLTELSKKSVPFQFGAKEREIFMMLKDALVSPSVLQLPDFSKPSEVICDESDVDIGAILLRDECPITYEFMNQDC